MGKKSKLKAEEKLESKVARVEKEVSTLEVSQSLYAKAE